MATNLEKLRGLLQELFQLDQADLDFGIYRIMNQKRDEVVRFLDKDLLPQVQSAFTHYKSADKSVLQNELDKLIVNITIAGMNPDQSPKVNELRQQLESSAIDVTALENEVFSHLFNFFRRYYSEGDFISLRRYKEGVYAIPYEGEEVKLHWANADQYYVKSSETFRDYTFKVAGDKRVRVHLVAASTEQDNNKAAPGKERRFVLADKPLTEENGELFVRFEYRLFEGKEKQEDLNKQAIEAVLKTPGFEKWSHELATLAPTEKNKNRTVLEKHLDNYTKRNTFDYFIHKDLGGFLRRELDFYIKNEVMHLDDIEHESAPKVEQYLSQIKVIRSIAHKIIQFLEQLENFQKKLWLKKKFVVETNYCVTLDRIPKKLYPQIATNEGQREEWVRLFRIDKVERDLNTPEYSVPLTQKFLESHEFLPVDTRHFASDFRLSVQSTLENHDSDLAGVAIHSDNFQGLNLTTARMQGKVRCIYIDPPYNTGTDGFVYKDLYQHSSWMCLLRDRCGLTSQLLSNDATIALHINDLEYWRLRGICGEIWGEDNYITTVTTKCATASSFKTVNLGPTEVTDHILLFAKDKSSYEPTQQYVPRRNVDLVHFSRFVEDRSLPPEQWKFIPIKQHVLKEMGFVEANTQQSMKAARAKLGNDAESIVAEKCEEFAVKNAHRVFDSKLFQKPSSWLKEHIERSREVDHVIELIRDKGAPIHLYKGRQLYFLENNFREIEGVRQLSESLSNLWTDLETNNLLYEGNVAFSYGKKPLLLVKRVVRMSDKADGEYVLDFFAGSGTTGHAVLEMNTQDHGHRKFVLIEQGAYFDSVLLERMKMALFVTDWKSGEPAGYRNESLAFKYIRLESYEDALNNLELKRTSQQDLILDDEPGVQEQYLLSYMLDVESRGSQSLLNIESFRNPYEYKLRVERNGETQLVNVDLVESFNWLLGLTVKHIDVIPLKKNGPSVRVVEGNAPNGDRVLVLWRNIDELDNDALDKWFAKQDYNTREMVYDLFYVNGDNNLENLRRPDQTWKVRLIEEEFQRLMFDVEDV